MFSLKRNVFSKTFKPMKAPVFSKNSENIFSGNDEDDEIESRRSIMNSCGLSDVMMGLGKSPEKKQRSTDKQGQDSGELDLEGIDDDEIDQVCNFCLVFFIYS